MIRINNCWGVDIMVGTAVKLNNTDDVVVLLFFFCYYWSSCACCSSVILRLILSSWEMVHRFNDNRCNNISKWNMMWGPRLSVHPRPFLHSLLPNHWLRRALDNAQCYVPETDMEGTNSLFDGNMHPDQPSKLLDDDCWRCRVHHLLPLAGWLSTG